MTMTYDLAIIGGGPAGAAAAVYAARKRLKTLIITKDWFGQSSVSEKIENWIGIVAISGPDLSKSLENHVKAYASDIIEIKEGEGVEEIKRVNEQGTMINDQVPNSGFVIKTNKSSYNAKTVLIATGSRRRKLDVIGADKFEHKGLTYCATCDGPLYTDQDVVVIGGGNAAFDSASQLLAYCKSVTILNRSENFKADPGTIEVIRKNPKLKIITNAIPKEVRGNIFVTSIIYTDKNSGKDIEVTTTGIFVEIGSLPNTDFAKNIVKLDEFNRVPIDHRNQRTAMAGIWAAGDCTDGLYHQNNIAAGDAVKAIEDIYLWVKSR